MTATIRAPRNVYGNPKSTKVQPWTWQNGHGTETRGALLRSGRYTLFVGHDDLRDIADALHDLADRLEEWER